MNGKIKVTGEIHIEVNGWESYLYMGDTIIATSTDSYNSNYGPYAVHTDYTLVNTLEELNRANYICITSKRKHATLVDYFISVCDEE